MQLSAGLKPLSSNTLGSESALDGKLQSTPLPNHKEKLWVPTWCIWTPNSASSVLRPCRAADLKQTARASHQVEVPTARSHKEPYHSPRCPRPTNSTGGVAVGCATCAKLCNVPQKLHMCQWHTLRMLLILLAWRAIAALKMGHD